MQAVSGRGRVAYGCMGRGSCTYTGCSCRLIWVLGRNGLGHVRLGQRVNGLRSGVATGWAVGRI